MIGCVLLALTAPGAGLAAAPSPVFRVPFPATPDSIKPGVSVTSPNVPPYWQTRAEKTGYRSTADFDETVRYCRQLEAGTSWIKVLSYGASGQGRALPLLVLSKDRAFTPALARATAKPIVLIQNGIHSGEIEGKDATLALLRDIAVTKRLERLADSAIVLVLPIFSVDAHERRSPFNRINQNGPAEMGWRANPTGLNLNRDYMKAESPEMQALLGNVFTKWWPHLLIDNHTTDGADYQHDLTYSVNHGPTTPRPIDRWMREAVTGRIVERTRAMGHLTAPYLSFRDGYDPRSGIVEWAAPPRFSNGYPPLHGRAAILTETHMRKPYATRVAATYDFLVAILEEIHARPRDLTRAVEAAEAEIVARGRETDASRREVALASTSTDSADTFPYRGYVTRWERSDISGGIVPRYTTTPWDTVVPLYRQLRPTVTVRQPAGYLVPQEWTGVRRVLDLHAVRYRRFARAWSDTVEVQWITQWRAADGFEGHRPIEVQGLSLERRRRSYRAGDLWVPLDQPQGLVAVHLLEAQAPDGLLYWNAFDTVLLKKEYADEYVIEPIARAMMENDPALAEEFRRKVATDPGFAASPFARLDWFYRRTPWADPEQDVSPVARALRRPPDNVLAP